MPTVSVLLRPDESCLWIYLARSCHSLDKLLACGQKPKPAFPTEVMAPLWSLLVLISTWLSPILTRIIRDKSGGSTTQGVEKTA